MRIAVAGMMHETNTFNRHMTSLADFYLASGNEVESEAFWRQRNSIRGILDHLRGSGASVVPTYFARAIPSGLVERQAYRTISNRIISNLRTAGHLDGICIALHGSMAAEGEDDPEGNLLERLKHELGPDIPITCALDMHATVTPRMVQNCDGFAAYLTAPHLDGYETGVRAAALLLTTIDLPGGLVQGYERLPMLLAGEQSETDAEPMKTLMLLRDRLCHNAGLLDASFCLGFPWADSPHACVSVLTVGRPGEEKRISAGARSLAEEIWRRRFDFHFTTEAYSIEEALDAAEAHPEKPVIVSDSGDNPTAGASQDGVALVAALIARRSIHSLVSAVVDRRAYKICRYAGVGGIVNIDIGRMSPADPRPLHVAGARVIRLATCQKADVAVLDIGQLRLILCDRRIPVYEPSLILDLDLDPDDYSIIAVKCGYQGPEYRAIAARSILALTSGDSAEDLRSLPYRRIKRPSYPLDEDARWIPESAPRSSGQTHLRKSVSF